MTFEDIILITTADNDIANYFNTDLVLCIDSIKENSISLINKYHKEDSLYDLICKEIDTIIMSKKISGIIMSFQLNNYNCFSIAHHIRLHNSLNPTNNYLPIILTNPEDISLSSPIFTVSNEYGILRNGGVCFVKEEKLLSFQPDLITGKQPIYEIIEKLNSNFNYENYLYNLKIEATESTSRHQISNEWGALRLLRNSGFSDDEIDYQYPPTLYFKFLSKKFEKNEISQEKRAELIRELECLIENKLNFSNHPYLQNKRVLLIDDNFGKGWEKVLEKIFDTSIHCKQTIEEVLSINNYDKYELVFLDLYLPDKSISLNQVAKENSLKVLSELKKEYPQVPIIIFTASNKSWTLREVTELGSDGMYVKESPEFAGDSTYSIENFASFVNTVSKVLSKYQILRPYWENIQTILDNPNFKSIPEKKNTKFKERIEERLKMFYGLLKKGYEQSDYDKQTFFYSDYELAFMTLWSVLNEIQEAFYTKTQPPVQITKEDRTLINLHPNGKRITYPNKKFSKNYLWKINNDEFLHGKFKLKTYKGHELIDKNGFYELHPLEFSKIMMDKENRTFKKCSKAEKTEIKFHDSIQMQIAGILLLKKWPKNELQIEKHLTELYKLNQFRNRLFLIHGSNIDENFFLSTEEFKRQEVKEANPNAAVEVEVKITDLFSLVFFLLTGGEMQPKEI